MKSSTYFLASVALATSALASPSRRHKCHKNHSSLSSISSSMLYPASSSQVPNPGTICTSSTTTVETEIDTVTVTPTPSTVSTTTTETQTETQTTTLSQVTSVFTSVSTITETDTDTTTETTTVSETATTTVMDGTSTTTVPTPAGFTPIQSVYPPGSPSKRNEGVLHARETSGAVVATAAMPVCTETVSETATSSVTTTIMTTIDVPTPTTTLTDTTTATTTSTVLLQPASTTETLFTTETATSTATVISLTTTTTTTTTTVPAATATAYAVCAPDNYINSVQGIYIDSLYPDASYYPLPGKTPADCCASCAADPTCLIAFYQHFVNGCYGTKDNSLTCDAASTRGTFSTWTGRTDLFATVMNNGCGQWKQVIE